MNEIKLCNNCFTSRIDSDSIHYKENYYCSMLCFHDSVRLSENNLTYTELEEKISNLESDIEDLEREVENLEDTCSKDTDLENKLENIEFLVDRNEVGEGIFSYTNYEKFIEDLRRIIND
jgi:predicted RNase H-like nuclease (RuvC/YqgF family)